MEDDDSPYRISVAHRGEHTFPAAAGIVDAIERTLKRFHCERARISVALVDDAHIADLNERHLGHDGPTDCLTFDLGEDPNEVDGEIVISVDTAAREASARGHDTGAEILLYAVHGTLHLLGMDDATSEDAARMHGVEDEVLLGMGLGPVFSATTP